MNILFLTSFNVTKNASGGISRVTCNLSKLFTENGHKCNLAYLNEVPGESDGSFATITRITPNEEVFDLLASNNELFIVQIQISKAHIHLLPILKSLRGKYGTKIIYCHHNVPFVETSGYDLNYLKFLLFHSSLNKKKRFSEIMWCLIVCLLPEYAKRRIAKRKQLIVDSLDLTILLSDAYVSEFTKYVKCCDSSVLSIGNSFSFKDHITNDELKNKEKIILMVSNMTERAKRITTALNIWSFVSQKEISKEWKFILLGDGEDLHYYRKLAQKKNLKNIQFIGKTDPLPYYKKSSILLLTSAFEGLPMVLLEAQQMGCVPVAFNSFAAVNDIIKNDYNGIIIPNNDKLFFADQLLNLMQNKQMRQTIALNCIESKELFSNKAIYNKWQKVFKSIP